MKEKKFILIVLISAFLLRAILAIGYQWYIDKCDGGKTFAPDEGYYLTLAAYQDLLFKGKDISHLPEEYFPRMDSNTRRSFKRFLVRLYPTPIYSKCLENSHIPLIGSRIYSFFLGCLYFVFGYSSLLARFFSIFIGLAAGLAVYYTAKLVFTEMAARLAFVFFVFSPIQVFLSISILSDILLVFSTILFPLIVCKMKNLKTGLVLLIPLSIVLYIYFFLQGSLLYPLILILGIAVLIKTLDFKRRKVLSFILTAVLLASLFNVKAFLYLTDLAKNSYAELLQRHIFIVKDVKSASFEEEGVYSTEEPGDMAYKLLPDKFYGADHTKYANKNLVLADIRIRNAVKGYFKGLFYIFFKPFPWYIKKLTHALASVQMIFWYILLPFMSAGIYFAVKKPTKEKLILAIFFFSFASVLALGEGNVGSLMRHREIMSFAYIIFGAAGIANILSIIKERR